MSHPHGGQNGSGLYIVCNVAWDLGGGKALQKCKMTPSYVPEGQDSSLAIFYSYHMKSEISNDVRHMFLLVDEDNGFGCFAISKLKHAGISILQKMLRFWFLIMFQAETSAFPPGHTACFPGSLMLEAASSLFGCKWVQPWQDLPQGRG